MKGKGNSSNSRCSSDKVKRYNITENNVAAMEQLISNTDKDFENTSYANTNSDIRQILKKRERKLKKQR